MKLSNFVFFAYVIASASAFAKYKGLSCTSYNSEFLGKAVRYCIHRSHGAEEPRKGDRLVYFFHGLNGDASHWESTGYAEVLDTLSGKQNFPKTTFISFNTGGTSFFSDFRNINAGPKAYETWLIEEFIPFIEETLEPCTKAKCRATLGVSMGGFGALKTALRHPDLFAAAAGNCPALPPMNAYDPYEAWKTYFARHPIGIFKGGFMLQMIKGVFPNYSVFDANDPAKLVLKLGGTDRLPSMYFDAGGRDYYGFQEGFERLKEAAQKVGHPIVTHFEPNMGHEISTKTRWDSVMFLQRYFNDVL